MGFRPFVELLEARTLLSGVTATLNAGKLGVFGDSTDNVIVVRLVKGDPGKIEIVDNGVPLSTTYAKADVKSLVVDGGAGNDRITIDDSNGAFTTTIPTTLMGGAGDDTLKGGAGDERLDGGSGTNVLLGGGGYDTFVYSASLDKLTSIKPEDSASSLPTLLGNIQSNVNIAAFANPVPLLGNALAAGNGIGQVFTGQSYGFSSAAFSALRQASGTGNRVDVEQALFDALGPKGKNLLAHVDDKGNVTNDVPTLDDVQVITSDGGKSVAFNMTLYRPEGLRTRFEDPDLPIFAKVPFGIGFPGVPLTVDNPQGLVSANVSFTYGFNFGVDATGKSFVGGKNTRFNYSVFAFAPKLVNKPGVSGVFNSTISDDPKNPSYLSASYSVDLDPSGTVTSSTISAGANISLNLKNDFGGSPINMTVLTNLVGTWTAFQANTMVPENAFGDMPTVTFKNVRLDVTSFFGTTLTPVLQKIQQYTKPLQPIIDIINKPIPLLTKLTGATVTFGTLIATQGAGAATLVAFSRVVGMINKMKLTPSSGNATYLLLGDFSTTDPRVTGAGVGASKPTVEIKSGLEAAKKVKESKDEVPTVGKKTGKTESSAGFTGGVEFGPNDGLSIPVLEDPSTLAKGFLGNDFNLITLDLPVLKAGFSYEKVVYPLAPWPLFVKIAGGLEFAADFKFGFDTHGIAQYVQDGKKDKSLIANGFFMGDTANVDGTGEDGAEVSITGKLEFTAGFGSPPGSKLTISAGATGGLTAGLDFNLHDVPQPDSWNSGLVVSWSSATQPKQVIPASAFTSDVPGKKNVTQPGLAEQDYKSTKAISDFPDYSKQGGFSSLSPDGNAKTYTNSFNTSDDFALIPKNYYAAIRVYSGYLTVPGTGTDAVEETFYLNSDNGARITIDGGKTATLVNKNNNDGMQEQQFKVKLTPGRHTIQIEYYNTTTYDGKVHLDELKDRYKLSALAIFDITAKLQLSFTLFAKISIGPFTLLNAEYKLPDFDVLEAANVSPVIYSLPDVAPPKKSATPPPPPPPLAIQQGNVLTLNVTGNDMTFYIDSSGGTAGDETILVSDGNRTTQFTGIKMIKGNFKGGANRVEVEDGVMADVSFVAGPGNDTFTDYGKGKATLDGGDGNDILMAAGGDATLLGGGGDDQLTYNGNGKALLDGGDGNDILTANGSGDCTLRGGAGDDSLMVTAGNNLLDGGPGNDNLQGGTGRDTLLGGAGNDILVAGSGNQLLDGGDGNDQLFAGAGSDTLLGGAGVDNFLWSVGNGPAVIDGGAGGELSTGDNDFLLLQGTSGDDRFTLANDPVDAATILVSANGASVRVKGMETFRIDTWQGNDSVVIDHLNNKLQKINLHLNNADDTPDGNTNGVTFFGTSADAAGIYIPGDLIPSIGDLPATPVPGGTFTLSAVAQTDTQMLNPTIPITKENSASYQWDITQPDGTHVTGTGKTFQFTPPQLGNYDVKLTYRSANGDLVTTENTFNVQVPSFGNATQLPAAPSQAVAVGDFNGDGLADIVSVDTGPGAGGAGNITVRLASPTQTFSGQQTLSFPGTPNQIFTVDVNGDGIRDQVALDSANNRVLISLGNGDSTYRLVQVLGTLDNPVGLAVGDFNSDGGLDLAASQPSSNSVRWWTAVLDSKTGKPTGTFMGREDITTGSSPTALVAGDFNNDGRLDLAALVTTGSSKAVQVILSTVDAGMRTQSAIPVNLATQTLAAGDVNRDGSTDLLVDNSAGNSVGLLLGMGDGTFQPVRLVDVGTPTRGALIADLNGKRSLILAGASNPVVVVLPGNGDGTFQPAVSLATPATPQQLLVGDVTNDQKPDVIIASGTPTPAAQPTIVPGLNVATYALGSIVYGTFGRMPDLTGLRPTQASTVTSAPNQSSNLTGDNTAIVYTGKINITTAGDTTFFLSSDDGSRLYLDGTVVVDNDGQHALIEKSGTRNLGAGLHDLRLEYFNATAGSGLILQYQPAGGTKQNIPDNNLFRPESSYGLRMATYSIPSTTSAMPDFSQLTPTSTRVASAPNQTGNFVGSNTAVLYTGTINITAAGSTTFYVSSDDGSRLYLDGQVVINNDGLHGNIEKSATVNLTAGPHTVRLEYFNTGGDSTLVFQYLPAGGTRQNINDAILTPAPIPPAQVVNGLNRSTYSLSSVSSSMPDFSQLTPSATSVAGAPNATGNFVGSNTAVLYTGLINIVAAGDTQFFLSSDDGSKLYIDGQLIVNNDGLHGNVEKSGTVNLTASLHTLRLEYYNSGGDSTLIFQYQPAGGTRQNVPSSILFTAAPSFLSVFPSNGDGTFAARRDLPLSALPSGLAVGDFNGDGRVDIAVASAVAGTVTTLYGGQFLPAISTPLTVNGTRVGGRSVVTADFDGDGNLDLAIASASSNSVLILFGKGDGTFGDPTSFNFNSAVDSLAVIDFNSDGKPDLVGADYSGGYVATLTNLGKGSFSLNTAVNNLPADRSDPSLAFATPTSIAVGDFNGDKKPDFAVATPAGTTTSGKVTVFLNLGGGGASFTSTSYTVGTNPRGLVAGDFNDDKKLDLVVVNQASTSTNGKQGTISVLLGDGKGSFTVSPTTYATSSQIGSPFDGPQAAVAADFNGDGKLDVVVANFNAFKGSTISELRGDGKGGFAAPVMYQAGKSPAGLAIGDFNGDLLPDLAVVSAANITASPANITGGSVTLLTNQPTFVSAGGPYTVAEGGKLTLDASGTLTPFASQAAYSWDLNGDGVFGDAFGINPTLTWDQLKALGINDGPRTIGNVDVLVTVPDGASGTVSFKAYTKALLNVVNTPPTLSASGAGTVNENSPYVLQLVNGGDPGQDTLQKWTINWGDGTADNVPGRATAATHVYKDSGNYVITVSGTDEDGTYGVLPLTALPADFSTLTVIHQTVDATVNYPAKSTSSVFASFPDLAEDFDGQWTGQVLIDQSGPVTFYVGSDDGSKLYIDGQLVVDNDGLHSMTEKSGTVNLTAGYHTLELDYFNHEGGTGLILSYQQGSGAKQVIPAGKLFNLQPAPTVTTANGISKSGKLLIQTAGAVTFYLGQTSPGQSGSLTVDGTKLELPANASGSGPGEVSIALTLSAGYHDVVLKGTGMAFPSLDYLLPGANQTRQPVTSAAIGQLAPGLLVNFYTPNRVDVQNVAPTAAFSAAGQIPGSVPNFDVLNLLGLAAVSTVDFPSASGSAGLPDANSDFAARYTGNLYAASEGSVTFAISSVGGSQLFIDDQLVIDNSGQHPLQTKSAPYPLTVGLHSIRLEYLYNQPANVTGAAVLSTNAPAQNIPAAGLTPVAPPSVQSTIGLLRSDYLLQSVGSKIPDVTGLLPTQQTLAGAPNFTGNFVGDNTVVVYTGSINITAAGSTKFFLSSDDGSRLYIDGQLIVDNDGLHGMTEKNGSITLSAGLHDLRLEYFNAGAGSGLVLQYQPAGGTQQSVPLGILSRPQNFNGLVKTTYSIDPGTTALPDFSTWTPTSTTLAGAPNVASNFIGDNTGVVYTGQITITSPGDTTFYLSSDDGSRLYIDGNLIIDNDGLNQNAEKSGTVKNMTAGQHDLRLAYFNVRRDIISNLVLQYQPAGGTRQDIRVGLLQPVNGLLLSTYALPAGTTRLPNFSTLTPTSTTVGFASQATQNFVGDNTGLVYTGKINITSAGDTTFFLNSDDGSRLYIDGNLIVDDDGVGSGLRANGTVKNLSAGLHDFRLEYFNGGGGSSLQLQWQPAGGSLQNLPYAIFTPATLAAPPVPTSPANGLAVTTYQLPVGTQGYPDFSNLVPAQVSFTNAAPNYTSNFVTPNTALVYTGKFNAATAGNHAFFLTSQGNSRLYLDGQLVIDNSDNGLNAKSTIVALTAGLHDLRLEYVSLGKNSQLVFQYLPPGVPKQVLPTTTVAPSQPGMLLTTFTSSNPNTPFPSDPFPTNLAAGSTVSTGTGSPAWTSQGFQGVGIPTTTTVAGVTGATALVYTGQLGYGGLNWRIKYGYPEAATGSNLQNQFRLYVDGKLVAQSADDRSQTQADVYIGASGVPASFRLEYINRDPNGGRGGLQIYPQRISGAVGVYSSPALTPQDPDIRYVSTGSYTVSGFTMTSYSLATPVDGFPDFPSLKSDSTTLVPSLNFLENAAPVPPGKAGAGRVYTGTINVSQAGPVQFYLNSAGVSRLYIDGKLVIGDNSQHPLLERTGIASLSAGTHDVRVEYYNQPAAPQITLQMQQGGQQQVIPSSLLAQNTPGLAAPVVMPASDPGRSTSTRTGKIYIAQGGDTTFFLTRPQAGQALVLMIDGQQIAATAGTGGANEVSGTMKQLTAGFHDISVAVTSAPGGNFAYGLDYTPAGGTRQPIPDSILFASGGLLAEWFTSIDTVSAASVSFANPQDPSPVDTTAGFTYSYDFNNDGTFEVANSTSPRINVPTQYLKTGLNVIHGRITDKDGGFTDYYASLRVLNVPPTVQATPSLADKALTLTGSFTDPDSKSWTATVDFGDGKGPQKLTLNADKTFSTQYTYAKPGNYTVTVQVTDDAGGVGTVQVTATLVGPPSPKVASISVNDGSDWRSLLQRVTVTFDGKVTIGANAFQLIQTGGGWVNGDYKSQVDWTNLIQVATATVNGKTVATLTFANPKGVNAVINNSLPDGWYQLTIRGSAVIGANGAELDGNNSGTPGSNFVFGGAKSDNFYRLFGAYIDTFGTGLGVTLNPPSWYGWDGNGNIPVNLYPQLDYDGQSDVIDALDKPEYTRRYDAKQAGKDFSARWN